MTRHLAPQPVLRQPLILLLAAVAACGGSTADESGDVQPVVTVRIDTVVARPFTETLGALGTVVPRTGHSSALSAPTAARVSRVFVTAGQHVAAGDTLVTFDQSPFAAALESAQAALAAAGSAQARAQRLVDAGIAARKDLDQANAELAQARANVATAQRDQELSIVRAPIGGVVTSVNAVLGASVDPSQVLVSLADPQALDLIFNVTPTDAARVHAGAGVTLTHGTGSAVDTVGTARVTDVGGAVDSATRSVAVRARLVASRRTLRLGETLDATIVVAVHQHSIAVPNEALVPEGESFHVFVVDSAGIAHARDVTLGARSDAESEVTSGVEAGDVIVTFGAYGVDDGARVVPGGK